MFESPAKWRDFTSTFLSKLGGSTSAGPGGRKRAAKPNTGDIKIISQWIGVSLTFCMLKISAAFWFENILVSQMLSVIIHDCLFIAGRHNSEVFCMALPNLEPLPRFRFWPFNASSIKPSKPIAYPMCNTNHNDGDHEVLPSNFPRWFTLGFCDNATQ